MTALTVTIPAATGEVPLVLLAPFPLDSRVWGRVVQRFGDAVVVDPPGFGGSGHDLEESLEGYGREVLRALDAGGIDRFVLAGNSMGGYAALAIAADAPDRVAGLGLIGTKASADTEPARQARLEMAGMADAGHGGEALLAGLFERIISPTTRRNQSDTVADLRQWFAEAPRDGIAWAQRAMAGRPDRAYVLAAFDGPAFVMRGQDDPITSAADHLSMANALGVDVITVPHCGHLVPLEAPDAVAEALVGLHAAAN